MLTYLVTVLVCLVPGGLLGFAIPPGRERWLAWAAAPVLTLGLTALGMDWLPALGLPSSAQWVFGLEIAAAAFTASASWLAARARPGAAAAGPAAEKILAAAVPGGTGRRGGVRPAPPSADETGPAGASASRPPPGWRNWLGSGSQRPRLADLIGVAVPVAVAAAVGRMLLGGLAYPPNWDAMNHALLTRNILHAGSTATTAVCTTGLPLPKTACTFSPLGINVSWAQTVALSGGHVSAAMLAWSVLIGPAALVLGVYASVRAFGGAPLVASCAAIAPVLISPVWSSLLTGRPPESFAPGLAVATALLAALAVRGRFPVRFGLLAGLGLAGLVVAHTYDVLLAGTLAAAFLLAEWRRVRLRPALTGAATTIVATLAACAPLTRGLLNVRNETAAATSPHVISFAKAWHFWVASPRNYLLLGSSPYHVPSPLHQWPVQAALWLTVPALLGSPLCFAFRQLSWARPWLLTWLAWTAVGIFTSVSASPLSVFLSSLWYAMPGRLRTMALPVTGVLAVAGAYAIGLCIQRVTKMIIHRDSGRGAVPLAAGAAAGVLAASLIALAAVPAARQPLIRQYLQREPVGQAYPRVFEWLARHTAPGNVIVYNRHEDFMTWSYADYGVPGLFGDPSRLAASERDYSDRWLAWLWLTGRPGTPPAGCLVRRYRIEYVVIGRQHLPQSAHFGEASLVSYSRARMAASPDIRLVHKDDGIRVYRVTDAGMACPG